MGEPETVKKSGNLLKTWFIQVFGTKAYVDHVVFYTHLYQSLFRSHSMREAGIRILPHVIGPGDVVFDIGANIGKFTSLSSSLIGPDGALYAFEPVDLPRKVLSRMVALKRLHQVRVFASAVSNVSRRSKMVVPMKDGWKPNAMIAYALPHHYKVREKVESTQDVEMTTLDGFCAAESVQRVDFIKCDTEGHEFNVLSGGKKTLRKHHPTVFCEIEEAYCKRNGVRPSQIFKFMAGLGYRGFLADESGQALNKVSGYQKPSDYYFVHRSKLPALSNKVRINP
jgi:FkbM family methyltransferase